MDLRAETAILGAGAVGLAVAHRLGDAGTVVVEAHARFGQETSSRNSEVIHSGIYYPAPSLKTQLCLSGRQRLLDFCASHWVPFRLCGKLVVAATPADTKALENIRDHSRQVGVPSEVWSGEKVASDQKGVACEQALFFSGSGILDSHRLMAALERLAISKGVSFAYRHRLTGIESDGQGWRLHLQSPEGPCVLRAARVVNAAGLSAAHWSNQALGLADYSHRWCRGRYFVLRPGAAQGLSRLVYPLPGPDGLGIHTTVDLSGAVRVGPDTDWFTDVAEAPALEWYGCDWEALRPRFVQAVRQYLPAVQGADLAPGLVGIRPKLFIRGEPSPDFLIERHGTWAHCLGIESPGLTSVLAIAQKVEEFW